MANVTGTTLSSPHFILLILLHLDGVKGLVCCKETFTQAVCLIPKLRLMGNLVPGTLTSL